MKTFLLSHSTGLGTPRSEIEPDSKQHAHETLMRWYGLPLTDYFQFDSSSTKETEPIESSLGKARPRFTSVQLIRSHGMSTSMTTKRVSSN